MITRTNAFAASDGQTFTELESAQGHELKLLLSTCGDCHAAISVLVAQREKVVDILSTTPTSKPRARSINGGKKPRKPKPDSTAVTAAVNRELQDGKQ